MIGFSMVKALEYDMDLVDLAILRWFVDFAGTNRMAHKEIDGQIYYWVKYDFLLEDIPIIKITSKDALARRLKRLVTVKILTHVTLREGGTFSYYGFGENYSELVRGTTQMTEPSSSKVGTNNPSTKDTSTKYNYQEVIDYLNEKTGKTFKAVESNNKLIRARYNEGYTLEDFYRVIDYKVLQWKGNEWEKYLRPSTLFSAKNFENYVNEAPRRSIECIKTETEEGEFTNFLDMVKRGGLDE